MDDGIEGIQRLMASDRSEPLNLGSSEEVTVDGLVDLVEEIAGVSLERRYRPDAPTGVAFRSSDNTAIRSALGWEPSVGLREGLAQTYAWIQQQVRAEAGGAANPG